MNIKTALQQGSKLLEEAGIEQSRLTAEVLLAHLLGKDRSYLYAHPDDELEYRVLVQFGRALYERLKGKPLHYITGHREFYGRDFLVSPATLIPRPETEHLVELALQIAPNVSSVIDVGTGSGVLAITLFLEMSGHPFTVATDISLPALQLAAQNAARLGARVHFVCCDLVSAICTSTFELLVSNPPYVPLTARHSLPNEVVAFEPHQALFAGPTGLEIYQRLVPEAARILKPGGWMLLELGFGQAESVASLLDHRLWTDILIEPDLAGIPRVLAARRTTKPYVLDP